MSRANVLLAALLVVAMGGCAAPRAAAPPAAGSPAATKPTTEAAPPPVALATEEDKTLYALGKILGRNLGVFQLTARELEIVEAGMGEMIFKAHPERIDLQVYGPKVDELARARGKQLAAAEKARGDAYRATVAREPGAETLPSGVVVKVERAGDGASPDPTGRVTVNYEGRLVDGTVFDSSYKRGQAVSFPLNGVIKCWTEGVGRMRVGGKSRLVCPPDQAYGDKGRPPAIPPDATLIFDVELVAVTPAAAPEPAQSPVSPK